jgi:DNA-binding MarR family transcriptional regulator
VTDQLLPTVPTEEATVDELEGLLTEVSALAVRLRQDGRRVQTAVEVPAGGHNVLRMLRRFGALTVPQMARLDSTSRQNIQTIVNRLESERCVELTPNPAHKRSELVRLTDRGSAALEVVSQNSEGYKARILPQLSKEELARASDLLRTIREGLCGVTIPTPEAELKNGSPLQSTKTTEGLASESKVEAPPPQRNQVEETFSDENELPISLL